MTYAGGTYLFYPSSRSILSPLFLYFIYIRDLGIRIATCEFRASLFDRFVFDDSGKADGVFDNVLINSCKILIGSWNKGCLGGAREDNAGIRGSFGENRKVDKRGTEQDLWHRPWKNVENESWNLLVKFPVILASDFEKYDFDRDPLPFRVVKRNGRS